MSPDTEEEGDGLFHFDSGMEYLSETGFQITTVGIPLLLAVTLHEVAHGAVADRLGDHTARTGLLAGRERWFSRSSADPVKSDAG